MSSQSATKTKVSKTTAPTAEGIYDVTRQLQGLVVKPRKAGYGSKTAIAFNAWLAKGAPEGALPTVVVRGAVMGSVGKSSEHRRGFDQHDFAIGGNVTTSTRVALGLSSEDQPNLKELVRGAFDKFLAARNPVTRSKFYQDSFPDRIVDGTQVFTATQAMLNPQEYVDMEFTDEDNRWDSPSRTWGSFLFGEADDDSMWYTKARINDDSVIYMYTNKMKQLQTTKEGGQVVYPRGGIEVKNAGVLRTLLNSDLYKNKHWRVHSTVSLTGLELKCGQVGETSAGHPRYAVAPVFSFKCSGAIMLMEHDQAADEGGLTADQRASAQMAAVFEGMTAPSRKRKIKDQVATQNAVAPTFNASMKRIRPTLVEEEVTAGPGFDETDDENSDGEDE